MKRDLQQLMRRELSLATHSGGSWAQGLVFFGLFVLLSALATGPDQAARLHLSSALVWLAAGLTSQLSLEGLFGPDLEDESLTVWVVRDRSLFAYVIGKFAAHWVSSFLPVLVLSPVAALMLGAKAENIFPLIISLLAGGPALILAGGMASSLSAKHKGAGLLLVLLSGPLLAAPMIFGIGAADAGSIWSPEMAMLCVTSLLSLAVCPAVSALALRVHLE